MKDQMKQALIKETERYIAQDILYDDVYVGRLLKRTVSIVPFMLWIGIATISGMMQAKSLSQMVN